MEILKIKRKIWIAGIVLGLLPLSLVFAQNFIGPKSAAGIGQGAVGVDAAGNLSIGSPNPQASTKLLLVGTSTGSSYYALQALNASAAPLFSVRSDGSIMMGTASPNASAISGLTVAQNIYAGGSLYGNFAGNVAAPNVTNGVFGSGAFAFPSTLGVNTLSAAVPQSLSVYGGGYFSGNVGIGLTGPTYALDVSGGDINTSGVYRKGGTAGVSPAACPANQTFSGITVSGGIVTSAGGCVAVGGGGGGSPGGAIGNVQFNKDTVSFGGSNNLFWDNTNSRLGIGTASPNNTLQVANLINFDPVTFTTSLGDQTGVGTVSNAPNTFVGFRAGKSNTNGTYNTAVGDNVLVSNTIGQDNAAFGHMTLNHNTGGTYNTAVGDLALYSGTTGSYNTAVGYKALWKADANNNTAVGYYALNQNTTGALNTAIGDAAGYHNLSGSSNVFIGSSAGFSELGSNKLVIANTPVAANDLIYGDFGTKQVAIGTNVLNGALNVLGDVHISGTLTSGVKDFDIPYPGDPSKRLVHSSLEGPDIAVYYRGESRLVNGRTEVSLPPYFEALTRAEGRTVLLTPKFDSEDEPMSSLAASSVSNGKFTVRAMDQNNPNQKFYWEVKAIRADVPPLHVVQDAL